MYWLRIHQPLGFDFLQTFLRPVSRFFSEAKRHAFVFDVVLKRHYDVILRCCHVIATYDIPFDTVKIFVDFYLILLDFTGFSLLLQNLNEIWVKFEWIWVKLTEMWMKIEWNLDEIKWNWMKVQLASLNFTQFSLKFHSNSLNFTQILQKPWKSSKVKIQ